MYIRDLRPGGACLVKVIYGPGQRAPTTTDGTTRPGRRRPPAHHGRLTLSESTPPARLRDIAQLRSMITDRGWRLKIRGVSLR
jgi:hypothetical protein